MGLEQGHQAFGGQQVWEDRTLWQSKKDPPQIQANPGHTLSLWRPQFPQVTQEEPCGLPGSELATLGGGGLGTSTALVSSHISVFPSLPLQDLCEVGP